MCTLVQVPDVAAPAVHPATPPFYNPPPSIPSHVARAIGWYAKLPNRRDTSAAAWWWRECRVGLCRGLVQDLRGSWTAPLEPARLSIRCTPYILPHGGSAARHAIHRTAHTGAATPVASRGQKRCCERAKIAFAVQTASGVV